MVLDRSLSDCRSNVECRLSHDGTWIAEHNGAVVGFVVPEPSLFGDEFIELVRVVPTA